MFITALHSAYGDNTWGPSTSLGVPPREAFGCNSNCSPTTSRICNKTHRTPLGLPFRPTPWTPPHPLSDPLSDPPPGLPQDPPSGSSLRRHSPDPPPLDPHWTPHGPPPRTPPPNPPRTPEWTPPRTPPPRTGQTNKHTDLKDFNIIDITTFSDINLLYYTVHQ